MTLVFLKSFFKLVGPLLMVSNDFDGLTGLRGFDWGRSRCPPSRASADTIGSSRTAIGGRLLEPL